MPVAGPVPDMQGASPGFAKSMLAERLAFAKCGGPGFAKDLVYESLRGKGLAVSVIGSAARVACGA
jgi:hypothetical protein